MISVRLRRAGFGTVHDAYIPAGLIDSSDRLLYPFGAVRGPVVARCGATLRGQLIVESPAVETDCRHCRAIKARP